MALLWQQTKARIEDIYHGRINSIVWRQHDTWGNIYTVNIIIIIIIIIIIVEFIITVIVTLISLEIW